MLNKNNIHVNDETCNHFPSPVPSGNMFATTYYPSSLSKYDFHPDSPCRTYMHSWEEAGLQPTNSSTTMYSSFRNQSKVLNSLKVNTKMISIRVIHEIPKYLAMQVILVLDYFFALKQFQLCVTAHYHFWPQHWDYKDFEYKSLRCKIPV